MSTIAAEIEGLSDLAQHPTVQGAVASVREFLGLDVAYIGELVDGVQQIRITDGDAASFGMPEGGMDVPDDQTICRRVLDGDAPAAMPDLLEVAEVRDLPAVQAAGMRSFTSVPIRFADGRLYGTLCAAGRDVHPELGEREVQFLHVFARLIADQLEREELTTRAEELERRAAAVQTLAAVIEARDAYTGEHSTAVVAHAVAVARRLGLDEDAVLDVEQVALLHDVGKLSTPDAILHKPGPLDPDEWEVMRGHPGAGAKLIADVPVLAHLAPALRAEHERWDGTGYPDGLAGEAIPLASRITLVCDAYDAMTSDRPYRAALSRDVARAEIEAGLGTQFCPIAGGALLDLL